CCIHQRAVTTAANQIPWRTNLALGSATLGGLRRTAVSAMRQAALKWWSDRRRIARVRQDCAASAAVVLAAILHYGAFWPLLLSALYARALIYSTLDNLPH